MANYSDANSGYDSVFGDYVSSMFPFTSTCLIGEICLNYLGIWGSTVISGINK